ncbi:MAG: HU family DNA-binding protein [Metamycoplasmataceae bacterium]
MTNKELMQLVAEQSNVSIKDAKEVVKTLCAVVIDEMKKGEKVQIPGFGTFKVSETKAREGINPLTQTKIKIEAKRKPKFLPAKNFKDEIAIK